jgi:hypothetical protein
MKLKGPAPELADGEFKWLYKSIQRQLDTDEHFRSDVALDIAGSFSREDYEEWVRYVEK